MCELAAYNEATEERQQYLGPPKLLPLFEHSSGFCISGGSYGHLHEVIFWARRSVEMVARRMLLEFELISTQIQHFRGKLDVL
jgi:hypothetical protein